MKTTTPIAKHSSPLGADIIKRVWEESWTYIKTVVDIVREPVLILDKELRVMAANEPFYRTFQVEHADTEGKVIYKLGNGQWDIPALRKLLEDILPHNTFFKGFEVDHVFPAIGRKVMILNARKIHSRPVDPDSDPALFPPIILLAIEDITDMMQVADTLAGHAKQLDGKFGARMHALEVLTSKMEKEIKEIKKKL
jgi:PAS domain-containing protein